MKRFIFKIKFSFPDSEPDDDASDLVEVDEDGNPVESEPTRSLPKDQAAVRRFLACRLTKLLTIDYPQPVRFRACFNEATFTLDDYLCNMLLEEPQDNESALFFDSWLHLQAIDFAGDDDFNQA